MRTGSIIAVTTAVFMAIGAALGSGLASGDANSLDDFQTIHYVRDIEHGQLAVFGDCPLGREIVVEHTGKVQISWYVQQSQHHGCARAIDLDSSADGDTRFDEPVIARTEATLDRADLRRLLDRLNGLQWASDWQDPKDMSVSGTAGCEQRTNSFSDRVLAVVKPGPKIANLWVYGEKVRAFGDADCTANEIANAAMLDTAVASFAPLLPTRYHLLPAVAERLYRKP